MKEKLSAATAFSKRAWDQTVVFLKIALSHAAVFAKFCWEHLKKAYAVFAPKFVSFCKLAFEKALAFLKIAFEKTSAFLKVVFEKAAAFLKEAFKDKQKVILAIILTVAILFSCIAVVRAVKGVVNGVAGIFTSDKAKEDPRLPEETIATSEEAVTATSDEADALTESSASTPVEPVS